MNLMRHVVGGAVAVPVGRVLHAPEPGVRCPPRAMLVLELRALVLARVGWWVHDALQVCLKERLQLGIDVPFLFGHLRDPQQHVLILDLRFLGLETAEQSVVPLLQRRGR